MKLTNNSNNKTVDYKHDKTKLKFKLSQELFSSQVIDYGVQRLLRTFIFQKVNWYNKVLDLGCSVGPLGITLKVLKPEAELQMVDEDALALEFSKENAKLNNVSDGISIYGSLGYESVEDKDFDLIVSNISKKIDESILTHILKDARHHLTDKGMVAIVVIDEISKITKEILMSDDNIKITYHHSWTGHHVYHYTFKKNDEGEEVVDSKVQATNFEYKNMKFSLDTTYNLPEYDELNYDTVIVLDKLKSLKDQPKNILTFNTGQGYISLAIMKQFHPNKLHVVNRDLLALTTTKTNLNSNGFEEKDTEYHHQLGIKVTDEKLDAVIGIMPAKKDLALYSMYINQIDEQLKLNGKAFIVSSSVVATRIEDLINVLDNLKVVKRERKKGFSLLLINKRG